MSRPKSVLFEVDPESGCWLWQGTTSWNGYGRIKRNGLLQWAHQWYWEERNGRTPEGFQLDHLCRVPRCVNPDHLEPVTAAENQRRGKSVRLTWEAVNFIREHQTEFSDRKLAHMFGVSHATIQKVRTFKSWVDLQYDPTLPKEN